MSPIPPGRWKRTQKRGWKNQRAISDIEIRFPNPPETSRTYSGDGPWVDSDLDAMVLHRLLGHAMVDLKLVIVIHSTSVGSGGIRGNALREPGSLWRKLVQSESLRHPRRVIGLRCSDLRVCQLTGRRPGQSPACFRRRPPVSRCRGTSSSA